MKDMVVTGNRRISLPFESVDEEPYIFASYGHNDKEIVFPLLKILYEAGYNIWYDEGIDIGEKYDDAIENRIRRSAVFVPFLSRLAVTRPYVVDVELRIAYENKLKVPVLPVLIEDGVEIPENVAKKLPPYYYSSISNLMEKLKELGIRNFGKRSAVPVEREVPQYWFDGHDFENIDDGKNIVYSSEHPYACLVFDAKDTVKCNPYAKELFFAGYNVRSCESCDGEERKKMLIDDGCKAFVPFVTQKYVDSGQLETDFRNAQQEGKKLIPLYIEADENIVLPPSISHDFGLLQGLNIKELTTNDFLSKLEKELETVNCFASMSDGKVERRSFKIKDYLYDFTEDKRALVLLKYTGSEKIVTVKKAYSGFPLRELGDSVFFCCRYITGITVPEGVIKLGNRAFYDCVCLQEITIADSVASIGDGAFAHCEQIQKIVVPASLETIGKGLFAKCVRLSSIDVSPDNKYFCSVDGVLYDKKKKTVIACPCEKDGLYKIEDGATTVRDNAFMDCSKLTAIIIPDSVTSIGDNAFHGCGNLQSMVIPYGVSTIGKGTFSFCDSLTSIDIPDSITSFGEESFSGCSALETLNIPDSVRTIGDWAFNNCRNLYRITIPKGITQINKGVFHGCDRMTAVDIPKSVINIGEAAFAGCSDLEEAAIPDSVINIGEKAFSGCESLRDMRIPEGVTSIGKEAFAGCVELFILTFPSSLVCIGEKAFSGCVGLRDLKIPDGVNYVGEFAFLACSGIRNVTIPNSVTRIGEGCFSECSSLTEITISDNVEMDVVSVFDGCCALESIKVSPENQFYCSIDGILFNKTCDTVIVCPQINMEQYIIPDSVRFIGERAFDGNNYIRSIQIRSNVENIGRGAFSNCGNLKKIHISESVKIIGKNAFLGSDKLTVYCMSGSYTWDYCKKHNIKTKRISHTKW